MTNELVQISIAEKAVLSINEAAAYSNIGVHKLQQICNTDEGKKFTFKNGNRNMIKRKTGFFYLKKEMNRYMESHGVELDRGENHGKMCETQTERVFKEAQLYSWKYDSMKSGYNR